MNSNQQYLAIRFIHKLASEEKDPYRCNVYKLSLSKFVTLINRSSLMPEPKIVCDWLVENKIATINYDHIRLQFPFILKYFKKYKLSKKPLIDMEKISTQYFNEIDKRNKEWDKQDKILAKKLNEQKLHDKFKEY